MADKQVETKVVQVKFDNSKFSKKIDKTIKQCEKFDKSLQFKGSKNNISDIQKALDEIDLKDKNKELEKTEGSVNRLTISFKELLKLRLLSKAIDTVISKSTAMIKSMLGINNIIAGWQQYETQMTNVGGILNQVESKGYGLSDVADAMERLRWYTDETSYSFTTLSNGIRQFVIAGVDLNKAAEAAMGVTNLAGSAKVFDEFKIQSAMDAVSKAMQTGYMDTMKWTSLTNTAGVVTEEFSQKLLDEAVAQGKLIKSAAGFYKTKKSGKTVTTENIRSTLSDKWLTTDVLANVMDEYASASTAVEKFSGLMAEHTDENLAEINEMFKDSGKQFESWDDIINATYKNSDDEITGVFDDIEDVTGMTARQTGLALENLGYQFDEVSYKAFKSAQETTSFSQAITYVKKAISTQWANIFEKIFGDYETATGLWSDVSDKFYAIFVAPFESLTDIFSEWSELTIGGASDFRKTILTIIDVVGKFKDAIAKGFGEVFGTVDSSILQKITLRLKSFFETIYNNEEFFNIITNFAKVLAIIYKTYSKLRSAVFGALGKVFEALGPPIEKVSEVLVDLAEALSEIVIALVDSGIIDFIADVVVGVIKLLTNALQALIKIFKGEPLGELGEDLSGDAINIFTSLQKIGSALASFLGTVLNLVSSGLTVILQGLGNVMSWFAEKFNEGSLTFAKAVKYFLIAVMALKLIKMIIAIKDIMSVFQALSDMLWVPWEWVFAKKLTAIAKLIFAIGAAVLMLSIAVANISKLTVGELVKSLIAVGLILGVLIWFSVYLSKLTKVEKQQNSLRFIAIAMSITLISLAVMILYKTISKLSIADAIKSTLVIIALFGSIMLILAGYNKLNSMMKGRKKDHKLLGTLLGISFVILAMSVLFKVVSKMNWNDVAKGIVSMVSVFAAVGFLIFVMNKTATSKKTKGIGRTVFALSVSLLIIAGVMKIISKMSGGDIAKSLLVIGGIMLLFVGLFKLIAIITKKMTAKQFTKTIKTIKLMRTVAFSLLIMSTAMLMLKNVSWSAIFKALVLMVGVFAIIMTACIVMSKFKKFGKDAKKTILMLIAVTFSLVVLSLALLLLNNVSWSSVAKGLVMLVSVMAIVLLTFYIMNKIKTKVRSAVKIILLLTAISAILLAFSIIMLIMKKVSMKDIGKGFLMLIGALVIMIATMKIFEKMNIEWKTIAKIALTMTILVLSFFLVSLAIDEILNLIFGLSKFIKKVGIDTVLVSLLVIVGVIVVTILAMVIMFKKLKIGDVLKASLYFTLLVIPVVLAILIVAFTINLISDMASKDTFEKAVKTVAIITAVLLGMVIAMLFVTQFIQNNFTTILALAALVLAMGLTIALIAISMKIVSDIKENDLKKAEKVITTMMIVLSAITLLFMAFAKGDKTTVLTGVATILAMALAAVLIASALKIIADMDMEKCKMAVITLSAMLLLLSAAVIILGALGSSGIGWVGVAMIVAIGAAAVLLASALLIVSVAIDKMVNSVIKLMNNITPEKCKNLRDFGASLVVLGTGTMINALANFGASILGVGQALNEFAISVINFGKVAVDTAAQALKKLGEALFGSKDLDEIKMLERKSKATAEYAEATKKLDEIDANKIADKIRIISSAIKDSFIASLTDGKDWGMGFTTFLNNLSELKRLLEEMPEPVIKPVLDLSEFNAGMEAIRNGEYNVRTKLYDSYAPVASMPSMSSLRDQGSSDRSNNAKASGIGTKAEAITINQEFMLTDALAYSYDTQRATANAIASATKSNFLKK